MTAQNFLSDRTHEVEWSGIRIMFALEDEIPDIINLGIGQPDFDTPEFIRDALPCDVSRTPNRLWTKVIPVIRRQRALRTFAM